MNIEDLILTDLEIEDIIHDSLMAMYEHDAEEYREVAKRAIQNIQAIAERDKVVIAFVPKGFEFKATKNPYYINQYAAKDSMWNEAQQDLLNEITKSLMVVENVIPPSLEGAEE